MIRLAENKDLGAIMNIYAAARKYMADSGNATQWADGYPMPEILEQDIQSRHLYVYTESDQIHGVFAFIVGPDETYRHIENGFWKNDEPYGTIHRIASGGLTKGVFERCFRFCREEIPSLRVDTHQDNHKMRYLVEKNGFEQCGIIRVRDGTPRIAYQYSEAEY